MKTALCFVAGFVAGVSVASTLVGTREAPAGNLAANGQPHNYHDPAFRTGDWYHSPSGQTIEIRGECRFPLHVTDEGAVEIETTAPKVLIVVHPLKPQGVLP